MMGSVLHFKNHASPWGVEDGSTLDGSHGSVGNRGGGLHLFRSREVEYFRSQLDSDVRFLGG